MFPEIVRPRSGLVLSTTVHADGLGLRVIEVHRYVCVLPLHGRTAEEHSKFVVNLSEKKTESEKRIQLS